MPKERNYIKRPKPRLDEDLVLSWADAYFERHGAWPRVISGTIPESPNDNWSNVNQAMALGLRGLLGNSSLALLLQEKRNVFNIKNQPRLTTEQILIWVDLHEERHGAYPTCTDGVIEGCLHEKWLGIDTALRRGARGFPGGSSLADFLSDHRSRRNPMSLPDLSEAVILQWADEYYNHHRRWPTVKLISIDSAPGETWISIDSSLRNGHRSLPGGSSLARLLAERRGKACRALLPKLAVEQIILWLKTYVAQHGNYPSARSGPIVDAPGEVWKQVDAALREGKRGLPGGSSLSELKKQRISSSLAIIPNNCS